MIFWYGDTAGWLGLAEPAATTVAAARALAAGFDPRVDAVPWGTALAPGPDPLALKPDGAAGVVPLLAWARHRPGGPPDGTRLPTRMPPRIRPPTPARLLKHPRLRSE